MMVITCLMVNVIYVFGMGIPAASGKVTKDPHHRRHPGRVQEPGHGGARAPVHLLRGRRHRRRPRRCRRHADLPHAPRRLRTVPAHGLQHDRREQVIPVAVSLAGIFAVGIFLVNAVLAAYNITGTIEGPHDPKFKRFPRAIVASLVASALCGMVAILVVVVNLNI